MTGPRNGGTGLVCDRDQPTTPGASEAEWHAVGRRTPVCTGFRALAYVDRGVCRLVSRNNHDFRSFAGLCDSLAAALGSHSAILDGEIACLDNSGRARFNALLYRRQEPYYYAFDCLWLDGRDLRQKPLFERKQILRTLVPAQPSRLLYVSHIEGCGVELFWAVCEQDLEGIVAKLKTAPYGTEPPSWVKIKPPEYRRKLPAQRSHAIENRRAVIIHSVRPAAEWQRNDRG